MIPKGRLGLLYSLGVPLFTCVLLCHCSTYLNGQESLLSGEGKVESLVVSENGSIYVATSDVILQFQNDNSSLDDLQSKVDITGNTSVFKLFKYKNTEYVLHCNFTACFAHKSSNISQFWQLQAWSETSAGNSLGGEHSAQVVFQPCEGSYCYLYSAISSDRDVETFSEREYEYYQEQFKFDHRQNDVKYHYIHSKNGTKFEFIFSFHSNGSVYFLRNTVTSSGTRIAYISQMCYTKIHAYFRSYMESKLECNGYMSLITATLVKTQTQDILVASFRGSQSKFPGSIVCKFPLDTVQKYFADEQKECFAGRKGSWPEWIDPPGPPGPSCSKTLDNREIACGHTNHNTRIQFDDSLKNVNSHDSVLLSNHKEMITSVLVMPHQDIFIGYLGTDAGHLEKILFDSSFEKSVTIFHASVSKEPGPVTSLTTSGDGSNLFFIQRTKMTSRLYKLSTVECTVHNECYGCLTDLLQCGWIQDTTHGGRCFARDTLGENPPSYFDAFCPPQVRDIQPKRGPTSGGTVLEITGLMDNKEQYKHRNQNSGVPVTVKIGNTTCSISDTSQFPERLKCRTASTQMPGDFSVVLKMHNNATNNPVEIFQPIHSHGVAEYKPTFIYVDPVLFDSDVSETVKLSGYIPITIQGDNLNIGSSKRVTVGKRDCLITKVDKMTDNEISCRAPEQNNTGNFTIVYHVDNIRVTGPVVTYVPEPVIQDIQPRLSIVSGGLTLTITGENLDGFGQTSQLHLDESNRTLTNLSLCEIVEAWSDKVLLCKTAAMESSIPPPFWAMPSLFSLYGIMKNMSQFLVRIVEDPSMQRDDRSIQVQENINHTEIRFKGTSLNNISKEDIKIYVGSSECSVNEVIEDDILCIMFDLKSTTGAQKERVKCTIGYRTYDLGTIAFLRQGGHTRTTKQPDTDNAGYGSVVVIMSLILVLIVVGIVGFGVKKFKSKRRNRSLDQPYNVHYSRDSNILTLDGLSESHTSDVIQNRQNDYQHNRFLRAAQDATFVKETEPLLPVLDENTKALFDQKNLIIPSECLVLGEIIGQGHFGCVYKGYFTLPNEKAEKIVACKTLHRNDPKDLDVSTFLKEALLMKDFHHNHVMELLGICLGLDSLPLVVLPFMREGDVLSYIRDVSKKPTVKDLVLFGVDITNGMHYLSQLKFVHRDLAARNCMIDDDMRVKVADFGLSRDVYEKEYYSSCDKKAKLPVKWMSPESLEFGHFTHKSDVWSFGVVLWELLTRGINPYPTVDNWDILRYLRDGRRLNKPDFCPEEMYQIMQHCWKWNPDDRPSFGDLTITVPELLRKLETRSSERRKQSETSYLTATD